MGRRRIVVLSSIAVAGAGVVAALAALTAADSPNTLLPPQAALLPREATFVMGVDVKRLTASPAYKKLQTGPMTSSRNAFGDLERRTGLVAERDLDRFVMAGTGGKDESAVAVVLGSFQRSKVEAALAAAGDVTSAPHRDRRLWSFTPAPGKKPQTLTVVQDGVILVGPAADVQAALDRQGPKAVGLTANTGLLALVDKVPAGATFWMCGDQGLVSAVGQAAPTSGWTVPAIKTLVISGDLDPDIKATIRAGAADATGAKGVADMLRGLLGMVAMQAAQRPELQELMTGIDVQQQGSEAVVGVRLSYDTLTKLQTPVRPRP